MTASFNIRFNDSRTAEDIEKWLRAHFDSVGANYTLETACSSNAFITEPGALSDDLVSAVKAVVGVHPEMSTTGGTSDARFIRKFCPVIEFGVVGKTMHKLNEHVEVKDVELLTDIYTELLDRFFKRVNA